MCWPNICRHWAHTSPAQYAIQHRHHTMACDAIRCVPMPRHRPPCSMRSRRPRPCCAACRPMPRVIRHCACCCPLCRPARHCAGWAICRPPQCMPTAPAAGSTSAVQPMPLRQPACSACGPKHNGVRLQKNAASHRRCSACPACTVPGAMRCCSWLGDVRATSCVLGWCSTGCTWMTWRRSLSRRCSGRAWMGCIYRPMTSRHRRRRYWPSPLSWAALRCRLQ